MSDNLKDFTKAAFELNEKFKSSGILDFISSLQISAAEATNSTDFQEFVKHLQNISSESLAALEKATELQQKADHS